jgi:hypothetical protein
MARLRLRDRFFTPPVAEAMTSPTGILLAGAGVAAGILAGLPAAGAAALGVAAWAVRVAVAVPRNPRSERIDPFALQDPWRQFVREALQARARFSDAVRQARGGPLRDRLAEISERLSTGVEESWRIARAGQALSDARRRIDVSQAIAQLTELTRNRPTPPRNDPTLERTIEALEAQIETARRMDAVIEDTRARLRLIDARLDESVSRAIELSVRAERADELGGLGEDVDSLVTELEALRQGLAETDGAAEGRGLAAPGSA